jgi:hypothetical protein
MLELVNSVNQTISSGGSVNLGDIKIKTNCEASVTSSTTLNIREPGLYRVSVLGNIGAAATQATLSLVDTSTNIVEPGGTAGFSGTSLTNTLTFPFSIEVVVQVRPSCAVINNTRHFKLVNGGTSSITISNLNVIVTRLD